MYPFLLTIHVAACVLMVIVVLLQAGRGAGLAVFGGGGDSMFQTPSGSSFMKKFTAALAITFCFTSLFLTLLSTRRGLESVTDRYGLGGPPPPQGQPPLSEKSSGAVPPKEGQPSKGDPAAPVKGDRPKADGAPAEVPGGKGPPASPETQKK